jgi:hypothetical protein
LKYYSALVLIWSAAAAFMPYAQAGERCLAYGDEKTDFTWRLCPAGEKYERQYLYFGIWSSFYSVPSDVGACVWSVGKSSWVCPDRTIRCNLNRCG